MSSSISAEIGNIAKNDESLLLERKASVTADELAVERKVILGCSNTVEYGPYYSDILSEHNCLFLDCQTTGASPSSGGNLLEVAWCSGSASGSFLTEVSSHLIMQPDEEPIPLRIQSLTGITDDAMVDAIYSGELVQRLLTSEQPSSLPRLCVIHYARFETPFLNLLMEEYTEEGRWPFQTVCTFEIARRLYPNLPSRGIRALGGFLGIDLEESKRAHSHVGATRVIWKHLVERLAQIGVHKFEDLEEFLSAKAQKRTGKLEYKLDPLKRLELPNCPGVYRMLSENGRVLYVGKATSLKSRVNSHFRGRKGKTSKSKELLTQVAEIDFTECGSPLESALLETDEIKKYDPPYNVSLKQRSRGLLFASRDFLSYSERQDEVHFIGPLLNPRGLDALLRLNVTINSGIVDPQVLFMEIPIEDLVEGVDVFLERHEIDWEDGMTPRTLVALGLRLFRTTRRVMRQLAIEQALAAAKAAEEGVVANPLQDLTPGVSAQSGDLQSSDSGIRLADIGRALAESEEFDDESMFEEIDELTPEEVADRLDSLLIGIARAYLVSKEVTSLLNSTLQFEYKSQKRHLMIREGRVYAGAPDESHEHISANGSSRWSNLDVRDYDRMRVLLTEILRMETTKSGITINPPLISLSRW